jgi:hypothetical protein
MPQHSDDLVRVAAGGLIEIRAWGDLLQAAGIEYRVVGEDLAAGLGTALPNSVELWVRRADAPAAEAAIAGAEARHHREPESRPVPPRAHPESAPKPDRSRGPQHGAPPHRPLS